MLNNTSNPFQSYINYLEAERGASPYTIRNYKNDLLGNYLRGTEKGFFQFLQSKGISRLDTVDKHTMRDYTAWLMEMEIARPSIARKLSAVRSFFRYLVREGYLTVNPLEEAASPKLDKRLPEFLTLEEVNKLLQTPDITTPLGQRDQAIMELLYASGLRVSELVNLNLEQVRLETRDLRVLGKGSKERMVLMGRPAVAALTAYLNSGRAGQLGKRKSDAVFINFGGARISARQIQKMLSNRARDAGLEKRVHPHLLRHTFATHMLNGGADLRVVQELLGHARLGTTQIYTHVTKSQVKKVYLSAHPMAQPKDNSDEHKQPPQ